MKLNSDPSKFIHPSKYTNELFRKRYVDDRLSTPSAVTFKYPYLVDVGSTAVPVQFVYTLTFHAT